MTLSPIGRCAAAAAAALCLLALAGSAPAAELLPSADGGFLTGWLVRGPLPPARGEALLAAGEPGEGWKPLFGPDITVDAGRARRPRPGLETWFGVVLVADRPLDLELRLGTDGIADAFVDGRAIGHHEVRRNALWDDHVARFHVAPGRHPLLVRTRKKKKQRGRGWQIVARVLDRNGAIPAGLRFDLPGLTDGPRHSAEAARLDLDVEVVRGGYRLRIAVLQSGSAVAGPPIPWTATRTGGDGPLATGTVGGPSQEVRLALPRDATVTLTVAAAGVTWSRRFVYRAAWHERLATARADLARAPADLPEAVLESVRYNIERLEENVRENIPERRWLDDQTILIASWAAAVAAGQDPFTTQRGAFYRAYRSPYDGRLQPYSVHVPARYDRNKRWPLVIGLHGIGSGSHYTLRRVLGKDRDIEHGEPGDKPMIRNNMPRLPDYGVITATAWSYHNSAYWFYGENDVLRVIDEVQQAYKIDPDRIYLTGLSLGGLGTYHVGHHFPDRFAALGPLGGFSSVKLYRQIRNHPKTAWEKVLIEQRDATTYAENGLHTPMKVVHGLKDGPAQAKAMTNRYKALGYRYELDLPDLGHDVWQYSYGNGALIRWMKRYRRPSPPKRVVFKTHAYRYTRAYWTRVGWIDDTTRPALLEVHVAGPRKVVIDRADNLRGITLDLAAAGLKGGPVSLVIQPTGTALDVPRPTVIHLRRDGAGPFALADSADPPPGYKRLGTSGPLDDVMFDPHVFVVGTQDPAQTDVNRRLVSEDHHYLRHRNHDIWFPVLDDTQVTEALMREKHLVLYGNPQSNAVLRRILATNKVPLRFEPDALSVGDQRFAGDDVGVKMIFPNPLAPGKVVVVVAGVTWRGTLLSRYLPRFLPDVIVYDERIATRYMERLLIDRPVRMGAFFGSDWRL